MQAVGHGLVVREQGSGSCVQAWGCLYSNLDSLTFKGLAVKSLGCTVNFGLPLTLYLSPLNPKLLNS